MCGSKFLTEYHSAFRTLTGLGSFVTGSNGAPPKSLQRRFRVRGPISRRYVGPQVWIQLDQLAQTLNYILKGELSCSTLVNEYITMIMIDMTEYITMIMIFPNRIAFPSQIPSMIVYLITNKAFH